MFRSLITFSKIELINFTKTTLMIKKLGLQKTQTSINWRNYVIFLKFINFSYKHVINFGCKQATMVVKPMARLQSD